MVSKGEIAFVRSLADRRNRVESGLFVAEGHKIVGEAMESGLRVRRIFSSDEFFESDQGERVSRKEIERMSSLKSPQGIIAIVEIPDHVIPKGIGEQLTLALDGIQDPGNLGTIIRLADWFGIEDILCSANTVDCYNPKVVQAAMGSLFRVRVHYVELAEVLGEAVERGVEIYGTFLEGDNIYRADIGLGSGGIVVLGSEGAGITPAVEDMVSRRLYIPPYPSNRASAESLNVATAAAIICSEFRRCAYGRSEVSPDTRD